MALFALICALLLAQFYPLPTTNPAWQAQQRLSDWALDYLDAGNPAHGWASWALAALPLTLLTVALHFLLRFVGWLPALVLHVLVLYLTLGLQQFNRNLAAISNALDAGDLARASTLLAQWKNTTNTRLPRHEITRQALNHGTLNAHRHVFGVLIAFALFAIFGLGPAGAVLYRCSEYVARHWPQQCNAADLTTGHAPRAATKAWSWIDWLPARISAFSFAVVGNFEQAIENWRQINEATPNSDQQSNADALVLAVAAGAMDQSGNFDSQTYTNRSNSSTANAGADDDPTLFDPPPTISQHAQHLPALIWLVWRAVLLWGGLIALVTITNWVS